MKALLALVLCALPALPQSGQTLHARAVYLRWKPGMREAGERFFRQIDRIAAENRAKADAHFVGQITMRRLHPTHDETGLDLLQIVITKTPLDSGTQGTSLLVPAAAWLEGVSGLEGTSLTPLQYRHTLESLVTVVKTEDWQSVYRHGAIHADDFVAYRSVAAKRAKPTEYLNHLRNYESAMRAQMVSDGIKEALESWQTRTTDGSGHFVSLAASHDSAGLFRSFPNGQDLFFEVHPGKSFRTYLEDSYEIAQTVQSLIFRVDSAVWR